MTHVRRSLRLLGSIFLRMDDAANGIDEPIHLSDWDPAWLEQARALMSEVARTIGRDAGVEHIGSTAVTRSMTC